MFILKILACKLLPFEKVRLSKKQGYFPLKKSGLQRKKFKINCRTYFGERRLHREIVDTKGRMECVFLDIWRQKRKHIIATPISNTDRTLRLRKFCAPCWLNLEKTKNQKTSRKPKNQNFSENVWSEAHVWFFLVFLEFFLFFFGHDLEKTKKTQGFFGFFGGTLTSSKPKNQKNSGLFWFFGQIFRRHVKTIHAKNQKRPEFFWFFTSL